MADIILLVISIILIFLGILGCILPVIPGPPLSFIGLLLLYFSSWGQFSADLLWIFGALALAVTLIDYIVPIWGTKKFGGSKRGIWGASIGLLIGLFIGPWGIIIGPFLGAFVGEITANTSTNKALKAAFGSFIGIITGIVLKLIVSGLITYYFLKELLF
jgi:uncharacterized protein YqgC (DUF456 family)